jgi:hypothetical protein
MATSIFFTESRDFKLIKDRILTHEDYYLVYIYADTSNIKIPKELIKELPIYGNNLIWVDTAFMDAADISHHIVFTIGQLVDPEDEINFYLVSRSAKLEKTIVFLRNQGIPAELISELVEKSKPAKSKGTGKRGRPKKAAAEKAAVPAEARKRGRPAKPASEKVEAVPVEPKKRGRKKTTKPVEPKAAKKRGRPKKEAAAITEAVPAAPKKRGRPAKEKPTKQESVKQPKEKKVKEKKETKKAAKKPAKKAKAKKVKAKKTVVKGPKPSKPRKVKPITESDINAKLEKFQVTDSIASKALSELFGIRKTERPKQLKTLVEKIARTTLEDETVVERLIDQMVTMGVIEVDSANGKVQYKD